MKFRKNILIKTAVRAISFGLAMLSFGLMSVPTAYAVEMNTIDYREKSQAQESFDYLQMLGIVEDDEGLMNASAITKSEAAELIVRLLDPYGVVSDKTYQAEFYTMFDDVETANAFGYAIERGVISGDAAGNYGINDRITCTQAAKMLVCAMGYNEMAQASGGWPAGYLTQAATLGITNGVSASADGISYSDFLCMLRNCFKVKVPKLEWVGDSEIISLKDLSTFEAHFLASKGWIMGKGIVNAAKHLSIMSGMEVTDGEILIGDEVYCANRTGIERYIGYEVKYVAKNPEKDAGNELIGFYITNDNYSVSFFHQEDCRLSGNLFLYTDSATEREKEFDLSPSAAYLYNNRLSQNVKNSNIDFSKTDVTLIDNNNDRIFDIVRVIESKSFTVQKISETSEKLYLKSGMHKGSASVNLKEDEDKTILITNLDGSDADWRELKEDDGISIIESEDGVYLEIIVLDAPVKGTVTSHQTGENVVIDETEYGLADTADNIVLGVLGKFWVNEYHEVFLADYDVGEYVYLVDAKYKNSGIDNVILVKLFNNQTGVTTYECSDSFKLNGIKQSIAASTVAALPVHQIASVTVNSKNLITKIDSIDVYAPSDDRTYCEYAHAFNDSDNTSKPFRFGENTEFYIVPKNGEDQDFGMPVDYEDGDKYTTAAYGFDDSTGLVETVVITVDTDALRTDSLSYKSDVGIVTDIKVKLDESEQPAYFMSGFSEGEEFHYVSGHYSDVFNVMSTLKAGDIVRFNRGYGDTIMKIERLASLSTLSNPFHTGRDDEAEKFFGTVMIADENVITNSSKYLYNELQVSAQKSYDDMMLMRIWADRKNTKDKNCQFNDYYIYDTKTWQIKPASIDDIVTYEMSTTDPSDVFVYRTYSEVKMLVIVE